MVEVLFSHTYTQRQEAPVFILSPRGMGFLFDPNRLNVAISRAQALAIVVGSTDLLSGEFGSLKEMELGNIFAWIMSRGTEGGIC